MLFSVVFVVFFMAYVSRNWTANTKGFMKIFHEILIFLLCKVLVYGSMVITSNCFVFFYNYEDKYNESILCVYYDAVAVYLYILMPFMNTLYHLMLIWHLIREVSNLGN